jgi:hypothetical protein
VILFTLNKTKKDNEIEQKKKGEIFKGKKEKET